MPEDDEDWPEPVVEHVYDPVWECIYCGATPENLGKEHIVPLGLGGTLILPRSSCRDCEVATSRFERIVQRGPMWNVRSLRKIPSRNPDQMPADTEIVVETDGEEGTVVLPLDDAPVLLHMPIFAEPSCLTGDVVGGGIEVEGMATIRYGRDPYLVGEELGADTIRVTDEYRPVAFARMIAKIGVSYAIAEVGLETFEEVYPLADLRGERDQIGRWVGTRQDRALEPRGGGLHRLARGRSEERDEIAAEVQLFSDGPTPTYFVVVGRMA